MVSSGTQGLTLSVAEVRRGRWGVGEGARAQPAHSEGVRRGSGTRPCRVWGVANTA